MAKSIRNRHSSHIHSKYCKIPIANKNNDIKPKSITTSLPYLNDARAEFCKFGKDNGGAIDFGGSQFNSAIQNKSNSNMNDDSRPQLKKNKTSLHHHNPGLIQCSKILPRTKTLPQVCDESQTFKTNCVETFDKEEKSKYGA